VCDTLRPIVHTQPDKVLATRLRWQLRFLSEATGFGDRANLYPLVSISTMYITAEYFRIGEPLTPLMRVMQNLVGKSPDADEAEAPSVTVGTPGGGPTGE